jgi:transposase
VNQDSAMIIGLDVGDKYTHVCVLEPLSGEVVEETRISTSPERVKSYFEQRQAARVALETGPHSPWLSRTIAAAGHEVVVANAREVRLIHGSKRKNDRLDAQKLARLARYDQRLLAPVRHRGEQAQADLARVRSREALVNSRTALVNHVRGVTKAFGSKIPKCATEVFHERAAAVLPEALKPALTPVLAVIEQLNQQISEIEAALDRLAKEHYPEVELLQQVYGVGLLTSLAFILILEDHTVFKKSREVGSYLGLTPGERQSGESNPKRRITKEGDELLRRLLTQCAHQVLKEKAPDCDLKRFGQRLIARGGDHAKVKAVTAVARKLAVLLHHLWATAEVYDPDYNHKRQSNKILAA